ncbi:F0F1 ATP synthase subunit delta [Litchfieldia salsa]|uniref:ATP synthase subunit delta n=1 Tax=Litchfieldia salsa TaxID=930152 RepID=A0A1H0U3L1_9BACI|nr:F0F1 ATP synthase subunit delta [Litchfieldia salsa]SDP60847.1 ATP synthase F1 subcomplex delta subunit [Litchfieldia salsa]
MSKGVVAKRYAVALFQLAKEQQTLDQIEAELRVVKHVFTTNKDLLVFLTSPKIQVEQKKAALKEAFASVSTVVLNTLYLMVDRHRETVVSDVVDHFIELANEESGVAEAKVYSVRPLSDAEQAGVSSVFAKSIGKSALRIENIVDKSLIGGVKIRIGNRIYDGSVNGKLERLERDLMTKRL